MTDSDEGQHDAKFVQAERGPLGNIYEVARQFIPKYWLHIWSATVSIGILFAINTVIADLQYKIGLSVVAITTWVIVVAIQTKLQVNYPPSK